MRRLITSSIGAGAIAICLLATGCGGRKTSYTKVEVGPHGQVQRVTHVPLTPEQQAARDASMGYAPQDPELLAIQKNWNRLTPEQRTSVAETVRKMAGE